MAGRVVLHMDMDAFYASVEQRDAPTLRGRPVIVGADPRGGQGRGVVAAASYEARARGIHSAMPIARAWRLAPDAAYVRPRIRRYSKISDAIFDEIEAQVDHFEPASIDEAYAEITVACQGNLHAAMSMARAIKGRIRRLHGLTCSIGIGPNKLVAKVASDLDKPDGLTCVGPDDISRVLGPLSARVLPGVGPKTGDQLERIGIRTVTDLAGADANELQERFGVWGPAMVRMARGEDDRPVDPHWDRKSVGAESTYLTDLPPEEAPAALDEVVDEALDRLRRAGDQGRTLTLKVRLADFTTFTRARTLPAPTDDPAVAKEVARRLLDEAAVRAPVRLLGLRFTGLARDAPRQTTMDGWPADVLGEAPTRFAQVWRF